MFSTHPLYQDDIDFIAGSALDWEALAGKSMLITGASGLIGTMLVDALMRRGVGHGGAIRVCAMGRSRERAARRFGAWFGNKNFTFIEHDVLTPFPTDMRADYIIHGAANTHPIAYAAEPVQSLLLPVLGTKNALDFAAQTGVKRTLFLSTVEIYGENRGDTERFAEDYCGYIDCNTLRAGYPEGKRAGEALCRAYSAEKSTDAVIARCSRVYGPTMSAGDSKAIAQFIRNAVSGGSIVLKSKGAQRYSYCYVADVCVALLTLLLNGEKDAAYNIAGDSDASLAEIAEMLSRINGRQVVFEVPSAAESAGYSTATKALLDCRKIHVLGWHPRYDIQAGLERTVEILRKETTYASV